MKNKTDDPNKKKKPPVPGSRTPGQPDDYSGIEMTENDRTEPDPTHNDVRSNESKPVITNKDSDKITNSDNDPINEKEKEGL